MFPCSFFLRCFELFCIAVKNGSFLKLPLHYDKSTNILFYPAFTIEVSIGDDLHPCCLSFSFMPYCYGCFQHRKLLRRDAGVTMDVSSYLRLKAILAFINSVLTLLENRWPRYPGRVLSSVLTGILMG